MPRTPSPGPLPRRVGLLGAALLLRLVLLAGPEALGATPPAPEERAPDLHLLAVGVSQYQHYRVNILFAENDARAIDASLTAAVQRGAAAGQRVGEVHSHLLTGFQVTLRNVQRAMDTIAAEARPDDLFVLFFSGFADILGEEGTHCLLLADTPRGAEARERSLTTGLLTAMVNRVPARRILLLLDTCDSEEALAEFTRQVSGAGDHGLHVGVISPTGEAGEDPDASHGVFTSFLLDALGGAADANGDGLLSFEELKGDLAARRSDLDPDYRAGGRRVGEDFLVCPAPAAPEPATPDPAPAPAPSTQVSLAAPLGTTGEGETTLTVRVTGQRTGRTLRVNGVAHAADTLRSQLGASLGDGATGRGVAAAITDFQVPVTLEVGDNPFQVEVLDASGAVEASAQFVVPAERVTRDFTATPRGTRTSEAPRGAPGRTHALIISTDEYAENSGWKDLRYPSKDAERLKAVLTDAYGVETRWEQNPTEDGFFQAIADYQQKEFGPQDQLLIFLAGHGYRSPALESGYLVCTDAAKPDDNQMKQYVSFDRLLKVIDVIPCPHILLLVDICHGGGIIDEAERQSDHPDGQTRFCIASGGPLRSVPDRSEFAQRILDKLEQADQEWVSQSVLYSAVEFDLDPLPWQGSFGASPARSGFRLFRVER